LDGIHSCAVEVRLESLSEQVTAVSANAVLGLPSRFGNQHDSLHFLIPDETDAVIGETTVDLLDGGGRGIVSAAFDVPDRLD
jgi:hypothetical protein